MSAPYETPKYDPRIRCVTGTSRQAYIIAAFAGALVALVLIVVRGWGL